MNTSKLVLLIGVVILILAAFGVDVSEKFNELAFGVAVCFASGLVP